MVAVVLRLQQKLVTNLLAATAKAQSAPVYTTHSATGFTAGIPTQM